MKKLIIKDSIIDVISAHAVSVATQFIVRSVGIGDAPQQAKLQGVYHLALLATFVSRIKRHYESAISINLDIFITDLIQLRPFVTRCCDYIYLYDMKSSKHTKFNLYYNGYHNA